MTSQRPTIVDLFCGAGGLSLGAARAGFLVKGVVDTDPHALSAHKANFRKTQHLSDDVATLTGESLRSSFDLVDKALTGIIGGPPCQGFSNIGRRDKEDARNQLFVEFFRLVAEAQPDFFLAENVPGIMNSDHSPIRERALAYVSKSYTLLDPMRVSANEYGAPTTRTRIFFFGYIKDRIGPFTEESFKPTTDVETVYVKDALEGLLIDVDSLWQKEIDGWRVSECNGQGYYQSRLHGHVPSGLGDPTAIRRLKAEGLASGTLGTVHTPNVARRFANLRPGERDPVSKTRRLDPEGFCPTLRAGTGPDLGSFQAVRPIHHAAPRVITPREAARLQGFPDWFTFSPSKWHSFRQIGSSVSPIIAERLMSPIWKSVER